MADDAQDAALDELYWVKPQDFTAVRSRLAEAARDRGDAAAAKQISASRKPTTAAWVVNRVALSRSRAKQTQALIAEQMQRSQLCPGLLICLAAHSLFRHFALLNMSANNIPPTLHQSGLQQAIP